MNKMGKWLLAASIAWSGSLMGSSLLLPQAAHAETPSSITYRYGMTSDAIKQLQTDLRTLGFFNYLTSTGYYGSITTAAVTAFQNAYGLAPDGLAGPVTLTAIAHAIVNQKLIADTYTYVGTPYRWGGSSPTTGFDCSGFVYFMFTKFGVAMQRTTSQQYFWMGTSVSRDRLRPGDLLFFGTSPTGINHVGFYIGGENFVSSTSSAGVKVQSLDVSYWASRYMGAKRVY